MIATALPKPQALRLAFAAWKLDQLAADPHEHRGIAMRCSRVDEIPLHGSLHWRKHRTWFGERVDPAVAERRVIGTLYTVPRMDSCVISLDEMGQVSAAKSSAGRMQVHSRTRLADRASQEIDYGQRAKANLRGFCPAPGEAITYPSPESGTDSAGGTGTGTGTPVGGTCEKGNNGKDSDKKASSGVRRSITSKSCQVFVRPQGPY